MTFFICFYLRNGAGVHPGQDRLVQQRFHAIAHIQIVIVKRPQLFAHRNQELVFRDVTKRKYLYSMVFTLQETRSQALENFLTFSFMQKRFGDISRDFTL